MNFDSAWRGIVLFVVIVAALSLFAGRAFAQSFDPPEFRVIPAPQDIGRIGVIRISCFDQSGDETLRYMQLDPPYTTLADGRQAHIPPDDWATWTDGVFSCAASVGKDESDTPVPSSPVSVEVDIPLSPPTLEVGGSPEPGGVLAVLCVAPEAMVGGGPEVFEYEGELCWPRFSPTGPYTERPTSRLIPRGTATTAETTS